MKNIAISIAIIFTLFFTGCVSKVSKNVYDLRKPHNIGVIIGHDIKATTSLTTGEEVLAGVAFGLIGAFLTEAIAEEWKVNFENEIKDMLWERIIRDMRDKNYAVKLLTFRQKGWKLLENISDKEEVYPNLVNYYKVGNLSKEYDALLFVEVLIEGRLTKHDTLEEMSVENMKMRYAKSKLFLYDTIDGKRIFHDMIQKGYPSYSKVKLSEALDKLIALEPLPTAIR